MKAHVLGFGLILGLVAAVTAEEPKEWKATGKIKIPNPATAAIISDDHNLVFIQTTRKVKRVSGGIGPGLVDITTLRGFNAADGKELFARDLGALSDLMSIRGYNLAFIPNLADKVVVYDVRGFRQLCACDTREASDNPPGSKDTPEAMGDFGGGGRVSDIELTADGKTLVVVRNACAGWMKTGKGGFTAESFQRVTFWDVEKGKKMATLDCEEKDLNDGKLALLPGRNQMLVKFSNGARVLDLGTRKWGKSFPIKDAAFADFSTDEKHVVFSDHYQAIKLFNIDSGKEEVSFKVKAIHRQPDLNPPAPGRFMVAPVVHFVDDGNVLRVRLNDGKTVVYYDAKSGEVVKKPASEAMTFPGGPAIVLAISRDRKCALTAPARGATNCTLWTRGEEKKE